MRRRQAKKIFSIGPRHPRYRRMIRWLPSSPLRVFAQASLAGVNLGDAFEDASIRMDAFGEAIADLLREASR